MTRQYGTPRESRSERAGVERLLAPVAQMDLDGARRDARLRAHDDERGVVHLDRDAQRPRLEVVALSVGPEIRVEVPEDTRVGDLDAVVTPRALAVDAEAPETRVRPRRGQGHGAAASCSKLTLAKVTAPSGSGHCP